MKKFTKTMEAHLKHGIGGATVATLKGLEARGLIEAAPGRPGCWQLSEKGLGEAFWFRGDPIVSWKAGVLTADDEAFAFNAMRFETKIEASRYLCELSRRWTAVRAVRVEPSTDPVNRRVVDGRVTVVEGAA